ncbi:olfactory receptor 2AJ1-like [Macrotis lagotis]|uniref:olfactory receptor 2AJ1-like n=1 Tax=Macrotis lagotis TaxID=92651 RepID=UPI003D68C6F9
MWNEKNQTFGGDFILLGLLDPNHYGFLLLALILIIFMLATMGNTVLILLIYLDVRLHTPMYFLLSHLSFTDILHISNIVPMMASNFITGRNSITLVGCGFQIFFSIMFLGVECLLLAAMSYDRYVAICHPLRYPIFMNHQISVFMASGCWFWGILNSTIHTTYVMLLPYCASRTIDHFFCEIPAMLKLSCADTSQYQTIGINASAVFFLLIPLSIILASYGQIFRTVLHIKSMEAQKKAFSTCSSHLVVVFMYYGPFTFTYTRPRSYHTPGQDKVLAISYTILTPMLNPFIYSLRNKDVLCAWKKVLGKIVMQRN